MSDLEQEKIDALTKRNAELEQQMSQNSQGIHGLLAQLDAHKQSLNEALNVGLNLRANLILVQKQNQEFNDRIKTLSSQLDEANKKVAELSAPIATPIPVAG